MAEKKSDLKEKSSLKDKKINEQVLEEVAGGGIIVLGGNKGDYDFFDNSKNYRGSLRNSIKKVVKK